MALERRGIAAIYMLSGATALAYEVLGARFLATILGNAAAGQAATLAIFLGGLAAGSAFFGSRADASPDRWRLYGGLELGVGMWGLGLPLLVAGASGLLDALGPALGPWPALVAGFELALGGLLFFPLTFLMGGTLPVLVRHTTTTMNELETSVARLYFVNSAGAVGGTLLTGLVAIPALGVAGTCMATAALNLALAAVVLRAPGTAVTDAPLPPGLASAPTQEEVYGPSAVHFATFAVLFTGMATLTAEVAYTRVLILVLGASVHAFTLVLAAFITGIALGSAWVARGWFPGRGALGRFGLAQCAAGVAMLVTLPSFERLQYLFMQSRGALGAAPTTHGAFLLLEFGTCLLVLLPATTMLGATLPLACRIATRTVAEAGGQVGRIYALNTLGNVLGAALAGVVALPMLGLRATFVAVVATHVVLGAIALSLVPAATRGRRTAGLIGLNLFMLIGTFALPAWDPRILSGGAFRERNPGRFATYDAFASEQTDRRTLFHADDAHGTVVVSTRAGLLTLLVNGKADASTAGDRPTQALLAHLPLLRRPAARRALVIGLGGGLTAASALTHPLEALDVVEISPAVVAACAHFAVANGNVLEDPRLNLIVDDAASALRGSTRRYDAIISEPSNPWVAGVGNLFSVEWLSRAAEHLAPGGLMVQWFHTYEMDDATLRLLLRTFAHVFPHVEIWQGTREDVILLGSRDPIPMDFAQMANGMARDSVHRDLAQIGINRLPTLLAAQWIAPPEIPRLFEPGGDPAPGNAPLNTLDRPLLEYQAPFAFYLGSQAKLLEAADSRLGQAFDATSAMWLGRYLATRQPLRGEEYREMLAYARDGVATIPWSQAIAKAWTRAWPDDEQARWQLAQLLGRLKDDDAALAEVDWLLVRHPGNADYLAAAVALETARARKQGTGEREAYHRALALIDRLAKERPATRAMGRLQAAHIHLALGDLDAMADALLAYGQADPVGLLSVARRAQVAEGWFALAAAAHGRGNFERERRALQQVLVLVPDHRLATGRLAELAQPAAR